VAQCHIALWMGHGPWASYSCNAMWPLILGSLSIERKKYFIPPIVMRSHPFWSFPNCVFFWCNWWPHRSAPFSVRYFYFDDNNIDPFLFVSIYPVGSMQCLWLSLCLDPSRSAWPLIVLRPRIVWSSLSHHTSLGVPLQRLCSHCPALSLFAFTFPLNIPPTIWPAHI
jgi:hypothetical protein